MSISSYRQHNQMDRIHNGRASGALTRAEGQDLRAQQREIRATRAEARADGVVTRGERREIRGMQNEASRDIYEAKHNDTTRQNNTPKVDRREGNQWSRIGQGIESGELTGHEARRLAGQQARIARYEAKAKSDGVVTEKERDKLDNMQDRASHTIFRLKHDRV